MNTPSPQKLEALLNLRISQINLLVSIFRENADLIQNKYCSTSSFDFRIFSWDSSEEIEATSADLSAAYSKLKKAYGRFHDNYDSILINLEGLCMRAKIEGFNSSISEEKREMNRVCYNFESAEQITVAINKLSSYVDSFLTKARCFLAFCKQAANFSKLH